MKYCTIKKEWTDSPEEEKLVFAIVEERGEDLLISPVLYDEPITPTEQVKKDMINLIIDTNK